MKRIVMTMFAVAVFATVSFAADNISQAREPGRNFEKHKADVLSRIDARIARNQEEKTCVQAAQKPADIKTCQDKFRAESKERHEQMRK